MARDFDLQVAVAETVEEMLGGLVRQHQSNSAAVAPGGTVYPEAVRNAIPWLAHDGVIEGTVATGSNHLRWPFPQGGVIRYVSIDAKVPPGSSGLNINISGGASTESFSLQSGVSNAGFPTSIVMPAGAWARVNVASASGAANVAITILYTSVGASGGSGGSGSGGGTGGAVSSVNGQTGIVVLDADSISDTSTTHKFVSSSDLTKLANLSGTNTGDQDLSGYVLSSSLSLVATSGDYNDLDNLPSLFDGDYNSLANKPTLGTAAAANTGDFATASQGSAADTAVQPADLADVATSGDYDDLDNLPAIPAQFNPIAGTNVSLSGTYPNITFNAAGGGGGGAVDSVNGQTGIVVLDADDIDDASTTHKFVTAADITKLGNTSGVNTGDQDLSGYATTTALSSGLAGKADVSSIPDALTDLDTTVTGSQLNSMKSKVEGIEDGAEANVQADWAASSGDAFVANKPILITATSGSAIHASTSTSATTYVGGSTLAVPSGEYRIHVFASFPMRRSVGSGDVWIRLRIGGTDGSERGWSLAGTGIAAGQWFTFAYAMNGQTFTTDGSGVLVEFGIRGGGTAGTTNLYQGTVFGTFTKIG